MSTRVNIKTVTHYYRILGLPVEASLEDCRRQRNSLLQKFHPDKQPEPWIAGTSPEQKVHLIQEAYQYIRQNFMQIQSLMKPMQDNQLTSNLPKQSKSHWVYTQIQNNLD